MATVKSWVYVKVLFTISCFLCCQATREKIFASDPQYREKKLVGDALMTYDDVTHMRCSAICLHEADCGFFFYNDDIRQCVMCSLGGSVSLVSESGWNAYILQREMADDGDNRTSNESWLHLVGGLKHVSVGPAGVWGVNSADNIFYREGSYQAPQSTGSSWTLISGGNVMHDVATDNVWAVNKWHTYYDRRAVAPSKPAGAFFTNRGSNTVWITASPSGNVWSVDISGNVKHCDNSSNTLPNGTGWTVLMSTVGNRVDAGLAGVWALDINGQLFYRYGTYGDPALNPGTEWRAVTGPPGPNPGTNSASKLISVSSGKNVMVGVDDTCRIWFRTGLGPDTPGGLAWVQVSGCLKQVEVYETDTVLALWGVDFVDQVFAKIVLK